MRKIDNIEDLHADAIADAICDGLEENGDELIQNILGEAWAVPRGTLTHYEVLISAKDVKDAHDMSEESEELLEYAIKHL